MAGGRAGDAMLCGVVQDQPLRERQLIAAREIDGEARAVVSVDVRDEIMTAVLQRTGVYLRRDVRYVVPRDTAPLRPPSSERYTSGTRR